MADYKSIFERNRKGIIRPKKFKMTKVWKVILGYYQVGIIEKDQYGRVLKS